MAIEDAALDEEEAELEKERDTYSDAIDFTGDVETR